MSKQLDYNAWKKYLSYTCNIFSRGQKTLLGQSNEYFVMRYFSKSSQWPRRPSSPEFAVVFLGPLLCGLVASRKVILAAHRSPLQILHYLSVSELYHLLQMSGIFTNKFKAVMGNPTVGLVHSSVTTLAPYCSA